MSDQRPTEIDLGHYDTEIKIIAREDGTMAVHAIHLSQGPNRLAQFKATEIVIHGGTLRWTLEKTADQVAADLLNESDTAREIAAGEPKSVRTGLPHCYGSLCHYDGETVTCTCTCRFCDTERAEEILDFVRQEFPEALPTELRPLFSEVIDRHTERWYGYVKDTSQRDLLAEELVDGLRTLDIEAFIHEGLTILAKPIDSVVMEDLRAGDTATTSMRHDTLWETKRRFMRRTSPPHSGPEAEAAAGMFEVALGSGHTSTCSLGPNHEGGCA